MWRWLSVLVVFLRAVVPAQADDTPLVEVRNGRLHPAALSVHVGEVVRWTPAPGQSLRVELDPHPGAHEVAERAGDVSAIFLKSGEHNYIVTILPTGQRFHGTVSVREPRGAWQRALDCAEGSSNRICFMR